MRIAGQDFDGGPMLPVPMIRPLTPDEEIRRQKRAELFLNLSSQLGEQPEIVAEEQDKQFQSGIPAALTRMADNRVKKPIDLTGSDPILAKVIEDAPHRAAYLKDYIAQWDAFAREARLFDTPEGPKASLYELAVRNKAAEKLETETNETAKRNAVMRYMQVRFGDWRDVDDATLRARLRISGDAVGIKTDTWNLDEFRKRGVKEAVDYGALINMFGVRDVNAALDYASMDPKEVASADKNSPIPVLLAKQRVLDDENDELRGQTWWADTVNAVFQSVPFMAETLLTGPDSLTIRAISRAGYKKFWKEHGLRGIAALLGRGMKDALKVGALRLPAYLPSAAAKAYNESHAGGAVTIPNGFGGAVTEVSDDQVDSFFTRFLSHIFEQYTEVVSEELGGLMPFGKLDAVLMSKLFRPEIRQAVVRRLAWNPMTRDFVRKAIFNNVPFNGLLGEYAEEEIGNMMSFGATVLMTAFGADLENTPGTTAPLMSWSERGRTLVTVGLQTGMIRGSLASVRTWGQGGAARTILNAAKTKREIEQTNNLVEMVKELPPSQTSVGETKRLLQAVRRGDVTVSVAPDDANEMLSEAVKGKSKEEAKELLRTFADAGVTEESIAQAKKEGVNLALSHAGLVAIAANKNYKNGNEVKDAILGNAVSLVFGKKVKELSKDSFTVEQVKELADRLTRIDKIVSDTRKVVSESFRTAQKNATDKGSKLGVSYRAFHDFLDVLSFKAAYLARHLKNEEGMERLEQMVKGLSIQFAEDPEKFGTNGALAQVDNLWTGSAADYSQPSLQFVGTGEGAQVYGWGLYSSSDEGVARWYAQKDVERKARLVPQEAEVKVRGENIKLNRSVSIGDILRKYYPNDEGKQDVLEAIIYASIAHPEYDTKKLVPYIKKLLNYNTSDKARVDNLYSALSSVMEEVEIKPIMPNGDVHHNLYKQTFWPDKEENLLDWDEDIEAEQAKQILRQAKKERLFDIIPKEEKFSYGDSIIDSTVYLRTYLTGAAEGETILRGRVLYFTLEKIFESKKAASEFLYRAGIDGVTYIGDSSGVRNYVAFSDKDIVIDEHIRYQNGEMLQGAIDLTKFAESQRAIISLFKDANASTLPHESAHWLKEAMESLVAAGLADEEMAADLQSVNDWLDKQDYSAEAVGKFASNAVKDGVVDKAQARDEYFARAFEQYLQDGKFPEAATSGLKSALRSLTRALQAIYQKALIMGSPIDDSIRGFFDGLFTVDEVVDGTSTVVAILREVNAEAIALGKDDRAKLEKAVAGAEKDAESEAWLAAFQAYLKGLRSGRRQWRQEAKEAYAADKAEQAFAYVKAGHRLDEAFLRDILKLDEDTIAKLKAKRLVVKGAPVAAEPETVPANTPAAPAPAGPATELTGDAEQFKSLSDDAVVTLPADEVKAEDILSKLILGDIGKGGPMRKRLTIPKNVQVEDALYKGWQAAVKFFAKGKPVTKGELISYVSEAIKNLGKQGYRDDSAAPDSLNATIDNGEGGKTELGDLIGETDQAVGGGFSDVETYLDMMSDWTDTLKEGTTKREIADILYELADLGEIEPSNARIWGVYQERGFGAAEKTVYNAIPEVLKSRKDYFKSQGVRYQTAATNAPADIMKTMKELGYGDAMALIRDLVSAVGQKQFIRDFMSRKEAEYREAFLDAPEWASETGATRYLNALLGAMKITDGMKFNERVKIAREAARRELMTSGSVRDIISGERNVAASLRTNASLVLKALKSGKEDKASAVSAALDMYRNAERLKAIRALRADIQKTANAARRVGKMKPGSTVDGDTLNAVKSLLKRFGLSSAEPKWTTGPKDPQCVDDVLKILMGDNASYIEERKKWDRWMNDVIDGKVAPTSYANLTPEQFYELTDFISFLRGEGAESLLASKESFASKLKEALDAILQGLEEHRTGNYTDHAKKTIVEKLGALARSGSHQGKTLLFMAHFLDGRTEFYGEHGIGPVRRFLELPLSEGSSREKFWYLKMSGEVKPHILALMKSAKDRKLSFAVNNDNRAYSVVSGEQAAFILLNAGMTENRQRLMMSFGWTEDELNNNLRQFTKEDFEHAEAIWASLHELGQELAKVFYEERHYRMPQGERVPIELTLADGTEIVSAGGYFPLAYAYVDSKGKGDTDIMEPVTRVNRPTRPSAVRERVKELEDASLLLDPMILDRCIREDARYIGMWHPLRLANAIWTDPKFKKAVITGYGQETYNALKALMDNVNNPDKAEHGFWKDAANRLSAALAVSALGFKLPTMAKQYASLTIGAERLGSYFYDAVEYALKNPRGLRREVGEMSPFMRDRYNLIDRDLAVVNDEFKGPVGKASAKFSRAALFGLKWNDLNVASVQWYAAYQWAIHNEKENLTESQARAYADDFVASTQGAARTIDIPLVQLEALGKMLTPFFGPACAAANTRIAGLRNLGKMGAGERIAFVLDNLMIPGITMALIAAVQRGLFFADDDDDWDRVRKQSFIALLTEPVSGVPIIQDIADGMVRSAVTGKPVSTGFFDVSLLRPAEDTARNADELLRHLDNIGYSLYLGTSIAGILTGMPVVQVYEEYEKMYQWNFGDSKSKKLKQTLKGGNKK